MQLAQRESIQHSHLLGQGAYGHCLIGTPALPVQLPCKGADTTPSRCAGRQLVPPQQRACEHERGLWQPLLGLCAGGGRGAGAAYPAGPDSRQNLVCTPASLFPSLAALLFLMHAQIFCMDPRIGCRTNALLAPVRGCTRILPSCFDAPLHYAAFPAVRECALGRYQNAILAQHTQNCLKTVFKHCIAFSFARSESCSFSRIMSFVASQLPALPIGCCPECCTHRLAQAAAARLLLRYLLSAAAGPGGAFEL